jgi:hypothetical protein
MPSEIAAGMVFEPPRRQGGAAGAENKIRADFTFSQYFQINGSLQL